MVPHRAILGFSLTGRMLWTLVLVPLPVFFAGLIFSTTFREGRSASSCFGANLIGSTMGGFAEYLGMMLGYQGLSMLVIIAYLASLLMIVGRKREKSARPFSGESERPIFDSGKLA
jgi:hypothetical protein